MTLLETQNTESVQSSTQKSQDSLRKTLENNAGVQTALFAGVAQDGLENLRQERIWLDRDKSAKHKRAFGETFDSTYDGGGEEVHVGDDNSNTHNHYYPEKKQSGAASSLAKTAIIGAAIASGFGGAGLGAGWLISEAIKNRPAPTSEFEDTDTDTQYEVRLK